ncbi:platelet-derived growth factor receptor alpha-like [Paramacrobiotus metropolitanus]|uniref:platelet-derived growth factor receptor alpha-like n=1 Tax=Paramacrobiotus metropolitanus TaxID=2943436 RepID=UPI0024459118|nr:platelet-derived growth factor receptor alpha-like [Paramacrobiotus metropolitanus]
MALGSFRLLFCVALLLLFIREIMGEESLKEVFRDDFDGDTVDLRKWYVSDTPSNVDGELQYFLPNNVMVSNGTMTITAKYIGQDRNSTPVDAFFANRNYTSGMIYTMNKFYFKYGEVEWRAKVAKGKSILSVIFLFSPMCTPVSKSCKGYWPPSVTVVGALGEHPRMIEMKSYYMDGQKPSLIKSNYTSTEDFSLDYHTYKLIWTETYLGWYIDGHEVYSIAEVKQIPSVVLGLVMKLGVGGAFAVNRHPDNSIFPVHYMIDYVVVRMYSNGSFFLALNDADADGSPYLAPVLGCVITFVVLLFSGGALGAIVWRRRHVIKKLKTMEILAGGMRKDSMDNLAYSSVEKSEMNPAVMNYVRLLEVPLANIEMSNLVLGRGEFGVVWKGIANGLINVACPAEVAIKTARDKKNPRHVRQLMEEMAIMSKAGRHLNICNLIGVVLKGETLLLLEFSRYDCLAKFLKCHRDAWFYSHTSATGDLLPFDDDEADRLQCILDLQLKNSDNNNKFDGKILSTNDLMSFAFQISRGMEYLGSRSIIHRDLAARNVLVCDGRVVKIADFGMAKQTLEYVLMDQQAFLPVRWMSPEAITERRFSVQSDVWSFGIAVWEIFSFGEHPYANMRTDVGDVVELVKSLRDGYRMERPTSCPTAIYELMVQCWNFDPRLRPDFTHLTQRLRTVIGRDLLSAYLCLDICYSQFNDQHREQLNVISQVAPEAGHSHQTAL